MLTYTGLYHIHEWCVLVPIQFILLSKSIFHKSTLNITRTKRIFISELVLEGSQLIWLEN